MVVCRESHPVALVLLFIERRGFWDRSVSSFVSKMKNSGPVIIIGAGPAGLTAAYELVRRGSLPIVIEKSDKVGGLARTEVYEGYRFDIGGHRFFTKVKEIEDLWREMLGDDFVKVKRLSRIYYKKKFYHYPLHFFNALSNLGILESSLVLLSYLKAKIKPYHDEETFEQWVVNRFGGRLYQTFFRSYTEKVWGIPCREIRADWAAQRIQGLSFTKAIANALFGSNGVKTLIHEFDYPVLGPGMMWGRFQKFVESHGGKIFLKTDVVRLNREGTKVKSVTLQSGGMVQEMEGPQFISTAPLHNLITRFDPRAPVEVLEAARGLKYRAFILVGLIINQPHLFPDNWIYVHSPDVRVGRIQNFKNWNPAMVPNPMKTSLGMEYFCTEGDEIWQMSDQELIQMATRELVRLGLAKEGVVKDGVVFRQAKAYPVYDHEYRERLSIIRSFLETIENLQTIGRGGMHRYNNQDHSMLTAMLAVENFFGEKHDLWKINVDRAYQEEVGTK